MDKSTLKTLFEENHWVPADQVADFGYVIPYVLYYRTLLHGEFIYLTCCTYDNKLVETVVEYYGGQKNTRCPKGLLMNWLNCKEDTPENKEKKEKARQVLVKGGYMANKTSLERDDETVVSLIKS